jgi:uncharacterized membrane protein HdeD (DUF308 family)
MSIAKPSLNTADITETIRTSWAVFLVQGIIMMVLGVLAVLWPHISTLAVDFYAGWMFLFSGLVGLVTMFMAPRASAFLWSLLTAALSLLVGVLLLWHPIAGAVSLTLVLIAFFIIEGIVQIATAFRHRVAFPQSWGWMVMSGVADLVLAAIMVWGWPVSAIWVLGLIVGVNLITSGLAITMVALAGRKIVATAGNVTR